MSKVTLLLAIALFITTTQAAFAVVTVKSHTGQSTKTSKAGYGPYLNRGYAQKVLWGDTHLHTTFSVDAALTGNRLSPDNAYRFAKGETVTASNGLPTKLMKPLDFLVVTDHAESLGLTELIREENEELLATPLGAKLARLVKANKLVRAMGVYDRSIMEAESTALLSDKSMQTMWQRITSAAEAHNKPGIFTAMIGFEWTSTPGGSNLHRNIIYRDGKVRADKLLPFSALDSDNPEHLWAWMEKYEQETNGQVLAIPHNGNLSNGLMFDDVTRTGEPLSRAYATARSRWEPIIEVTQMKGDGETHPALSATDEFADFETWDISNFASVPKTPDMINKEYAREALKRGLEYDAKLGANPFRFGMVGSSDTHTGLSTTREENFFHKLSVFEPTADPRRMEDVLIGYMLEEGEEGATLKSKQISASGLAAVWATDNSREAIWDAMKRKEVYASTGTRMTVRVFAGWNFSSEDLHRSDFVERGYKHGVPMGGDLAPMASGAANASPRLLIQALRDPDGANLDRIQVVKGWLDVTGRAQEKIYNVAWSGKRKLDRHGKLPAVGNSVNSSNATYINNIGKAQLAGYWQDPDFDVAQRAFYYVRVLESPTPRWTTNDAAVFGKQLTGGVPASLQERAYTSPIWYQPAL